MPLQKMTQQEPEREALEKVRQKLEDEFISQKDLYFIVRNQQIYPNSFMIIGIFYPPKVNFEQLSLF